MVFGYIAADIAARQVRKSRENADERDAERASEVPATVQVAVPLDSPYDPSDPHGDRSYRDGR